MTDFLAPNLVALASSTGRIPDIPDGSPRVSLTASESGTAVWLASPSGGRVAVHSRRDPVLEAERQLALALGDRPSPPAFVLVGVGLGYMIDVIERRYPTASILAVEPEAGCVRPLLSRRDFSGLITAGRLRLLWGPDYAGASDAWRVFGDSPVDPLVIGHPVAGQDPPGSQTLARDVVSKCIFGARQNAEARRRFAGRYLLNTLANLPMIRATADVSDLFGRFAGIPAVIASAGPSLDASLPVLAALGHRTLLISVDTALRPLLAAGIHPRFTVCVDPQPLNARHLWGLGCGVRTRFVAEGSIDPSAFAGFSDRIHIFRVSNHEPWPWLEERGMTRGLLRAWGSVATTAFDLAVQAGCHPIVFVGQDLAFTGDRPYARGTMAELRWAERVARGEQLIDVWRSEVEGQQVRSETGVDGDPVRTAGQLVAFRDWLSEEAARLEPGRVVNATGAGIFAGRNIRQAALAGTLDAIDPAVERQIDAVMGQFERADRARRARCSVADEDEWRCLEAGEEAALLDRWVRWTDDTVDRDTLGATFHDAVVRRPGVAAVSVPAGAPPSAGWRVWPPERAGRVRDLLQQRAVTSRGGGQEALRSSRRRLDRLLAEPRLVGQDAGAPRPNTSDIPAWHRFNWLDPVRSAVEEFEEVLAGAVEVGSRRLDPLGLEAFTSRATEPTSLEAPDRSGGGAPGPACDIDEQARRALTAEWLALAAACSSEEASGFSRVQARLALASSESDPASPQEPDPEPEVSLELGGMAGVRFPARPSRVMRRATGLLARADRDSAPGPGGLSRVADPRSAVLGRPFDAVEPMVLTGGRLPPAYIARSLDADAAVVTEVHTPRSYRVSGSGDVSLAYEWPRDITGEATFDAVGGALAWSNPGRYIMARRGTDGPVVIEDVPFRPLRVDVTGAGDVIWCGYDGGLWRWIPGSQGDKLADTPMPLSLQVTDDGVFIEPAFRRESDSYPLRVRSARRWLWRWGGRSVESVQGSTLGQCTSIARSLEWRAEAHPYADIIRISGPHGSTFDLACYYPLTLAWADDALLATTGDGDVLLFRSLVPRLRASATETTEAGS